MHSVRGLGKQDRVSDVLKDVDRFTFEAWELVDHRHRSLPFVAAGTFIGNVNPFFRAYWPRWRSG